MIPLLDLRAQMLPLREELQEALTRLLDSTQFIGGSALEAFEKDFGRYLGASHALGCSNGTEAVTLALQACGVKPGDRIVTVSMTFIATAEAIRDAGCEFAFVDVDPETDVMTGEILERFLSAEKKEGITYAGVIPVHLRGNPCNMRDILDVAKKYDLFVIEDGRKNDWKLRPGGDVQLFPRKKPRGAGRRRGCSYK
jgi:dTDP-4-amino-4,6-dideoxygalactose transaminase